MTDIKSILVPFYGDETETSALETAFILAKRFNACVSCVHASPGLHNFVYAEAMVPVTSYKDVTTAIKKQLNDQAEQAKSLFEAMAQIHDVSLCSDPIALLSQADGDRAVAHWVYRQNLNIEDAIAEYGKVSDLIVIGQSITEQHELYGSAIVASLFETGCGVLIIPPGLTPKTIGKNIAIAWQSNIPSSHAIALALPLLKNAERVSVISVNEEESISPCVDDLAQYLSLHKIPVNTVSIEPDDPSIGTVLIEQAKAEGADMLLMGAFAHSRFRQMLFGGVTHFMLNQSDLPVVMAH